MCLCRESLEGGRTISEGNRYGSVATDHIRVVHHPMGNGLDIFDERMSSGAKPNFDCRVEAAYGYEYEYEYEIAPRQVHLEAVPPLLLPCPASSPHRRLISSSIAVQDLAPLHLSARAPLRASHESTDSAESNQTHANSIQMQSQ